MANVTQLGKNWNSDFHKTTICITVWLSLNVMEGWVPTLMEPIQQERVIAHSTIQARWTKVCLSGPGDLDRKGILQHFVEARVLGGRKEKGAGLKVQQHQELPTLGLSSFRQTINMASPQVVQGEKPAVHSSLTVWEVKGGT